MDLMSMSAINIENLQFSYRDQPGPLFSNLNLQIDKGESFGIFGPNGAGKTTLMSIMTGLIDYSVGSVQLLGEEVKTKKKAFNKIFGFVPQDFSFYQELSPRENLEFFGAWAGLNPSSINQRTNELLDVLGLNDVRNKQVQKFSGGMKRRVNLAISVIHHPKILFLDEPTVGVDVQTRFAIIDYLKTLNAGGTTLIYTSHQLYEAETLCRKIALIDEGKIIAHDSLENLLSKHKQEGLEGLFLNLTGKSYRD
jgi:ABC-2 type transport system ATP-binding protein